MTPTRSPATDRTVAIAFVCSAVAALAAGPRAQALAEADISPLLLTQPKARVPAAAFARLWMAVARLLDDEFFGLDARRMKVGSFAMLCHALVGQPTVGAALRLALRGLGLLFDDIAASLRLGGGVASVVIDNRIGQGRRGVGATDAADAACVADARRFADETLLVMLHGLLCWLAGRRVALSRLDWAHPQPAHSDEYRRMFSPLLRFDAGATAICFDARVLQAAVTLSPAGLKAFLRDAPQSVFLKQVVATGLSDRARRLCREALDRGDPAPTLARVAGALDLSAATLRRRLEGEGASWGHLKDEVRRDLALQLLGAGHSGRAPSVGEIAARLGFNDASTFYRAFRKWTGCAPGAWRTAAVAAAAVAAAAAAHADAAPSACPVAAAQTLPEPGPRP
jgi:AraC-like DNA-binding protein